MYIAPHQHYLFYDAFHGQKTQRKMLWLLFEKAIRTIIHLIGYLKKMNQGHAIRLNSFEKKILE